MNSQRIPLRRHVACSVLFLTVAFSFFIRYALILWGPIDNQVMTQIPKAVLIDWAAEYPFADSAPISESEASAAAPPEKGDRTLFRRIDTWGKQATADIDEYAKENSLFRIPFSEANMYFRKWAGMRYFPDADGILLLNNGYLVGPRKWANVDSAAGHLAEFYTYCANRRLPFLYVVAPHKSDPLDPQLPRGMEDYGNDNTDRLLLSVHAAGVPVLDLRESIRTAGITNFYDLFFRSDHHWKPEVGLRAASLIAAEINRLYGFDLPASLFAPSRYQFKLYRRLFLGALGKKVTRAYAPPDDFRRITPRYDTDLTLSVPDQDLIRRGSFQDVLIRESQISDRVYYRRNPYAAYLYRDSPILTVENHRRSGGPRILLIKDSFANVVAPFLALTAGQVDVLDLRHFNGSVHAYIERNQPDAVVVLYNAGSMGGHFFRFE